MKLAFFSYRKDEEKFFQEFIEKYQVDAIYTKETPSLDSIEFARGCDCISIVTSKIDIPLIDKMKEIGIRYISTRTIGSDHIDVKYANKVGISVGNIAYSPNSVSEYAVMLMLMANRKVKHILERSIGQDYSLRCLRGYELRKQTVGVIGTGRIGQAVIHNLSGFGCNILAYAPHPKEELKGLALYTSLETLFQESDIITLHIPLTDNNFHMINSKVIAQMKDGVILINTARGSLIDTQALIDGIESGKIAAAALDVIENEIPIFFNDYKYTPIKNRDLAILKAFPNVIVTPHTAFYTNQAVSDMVENSIKNCVDFFSTNKKII